MVDGERLKRLKQFLTDYLTPVCSPRMYQGVPVLRGKTTKVLPEPLEIIERKNNLKLLGVTLEEKPD